MRLPKSLTKILLLTALLVGGNASAAVEFTSATATASSNRTVIFATWASDARLPTPPDLGPYLFYGPITSQTTNPTDLSGIALRETIEIIRGESWEALNARWSAVYGNSSSRLFTSAGSINGNQGTYICMALISGNGATRYKTSCTRIDYSTSNVYCDITGPSSLDYGVLDINSINGQVARLDATIQCSGAATVGLTSATTNITLGNGITATLKFNNGNARVQVNSGGMANVPIESILSATNPVAGNFSGSAVVVVSVL